MLQLRQLLHGLRHKLSGINTRAAFPTRGRPPQDKAPVQHRCVGTYRLWKDHADRTNPVLYWADARYS
jgi:hypothetical protein